MESSTSQPALARRVMLGTGCVLAGTLIGMAAITAVFADDDYATQTVLDDGVVIPYHGFLMLDTKSIDGPVTIKFDIYQESGGGSSLWDETHTLQVNNGRFAVGLGAQSDLSGLILQGKNLWVGMTIMEEDPNTGAITEIALSGRQAIDATPYAAWSGHADEFNVNGPLQVNGTSTIATAVTVNDDVTINAPSIMGSGAAPLRLQSTAGVAQTMRIDGNEFDSDNELYFQNNSGNATVIHGAMSVKGSSTIGDSYADQTTVQGVESTGSAGALTIASSATRKLFIDGNEINTANNADLEINVSSGTNTVFGGDLLVAGAYKLGYNNWDGGDTGDGGAAITNDDNTFDAVMVVGNVISGDRRVEIYDDLSVNDKLQVQGTSTFGDDVTISGSKSLEANTISFTTASCPGTTWGEMYSSTSKARLCVYNWNDDTDGDGTVNDVTNWNDASDACWNNYGAELCSYNQMRIILSKGGKDLTNDNTPSGTNNRWLRDRLRDDWAIMTDGTNEANFDVEDNGTTNRVGAFCCLSYSGY